LIGYGRVGTVVADGLKRQGAPFVLIEDSEKRVAAAPDSGIEVIVGNAATSNSLALANVAGARTLLIAIPNAFEAGQAVEQCHRLNPNLLIIARAHSDEEVIYLRDLGASEVIMGEREIGLGMLSWANGDKEHEVVAEREQAGFDAVAAALQPQLAPVVATYAAPPVAAPMPAADPEELEAAIEAAHPEHEPTGPAEPPELVPALGEMPEPEPEETGAELEPLPEPEPVAAVEPEPLPEPIAPIPEEPAKPRLRAGGPATSPASPFNPEVVPAEE
ncbi:MAG: NAD-binding protein, partial [Devosia sp.]|nr:NAD-binding protein [Devosia sp.]